MLDLPFARPAPRPTMPLAKSLGFMRQQSAPNPAARSTAPGGVMAARWARQEMVQQRRSLFPDTAKQVQNKLYASLRRRPAAVSQASAPGAGSKTPIGFGGSGYSGAPAATLGQASNPGYTVKAPSAVSPMLTGA